MTHLGGPVRPHTRHTFCLTGHHRAPLSSDTSAAPICTYSQPLNPPTVFSFARVAPIWGPLSRATTTHPPSLYPPPHLGAADAAPHTQPATTRHTHATPTLNKQQRRGSIVSPSFFPLLWGAASKGRRIYTPTPHPRAPSGQRPLARIKSIPFLKCNFPLPYPSLLMVLHWTAPLPSVSEKGAVGPLGETGRLLMRVSRAVSEDRGRRGVKRVKRGDQADTRPPARHG